MTPMHPDDLPEPESELPVLDFSTCFHSSAEQERWMNTLFEIHRSEILDRHARRVVAYIDTLKTLDEKADAKIEHAVGTKREAQVRAKAEMYRYARDMWNSEVSILMRDLRFDLATALENKYGSAAKKLVEMLRKNYVPVPEIFEGKDI
jgi:hypothetical protein